MTDVTVPTTQFYTWRHYRCAYELYAPTHPSAKGDIPLLLIHPIGLSGIFGIGSAEWRDRSL